MYNVYIWYHSFLFIAQMSERQVVVYFVYNNIKNKSAHTQQSKFKTHSPMPNRHSEKQLPACTEWRISIWEMNRNRQSVDVTDTWIEERLWKRQKTWETERNLKRKIKRRKYTERQTWKHELPAHLEMLKVKDMEKKGRNNKSCMSLSGCSSVCVTLSWKMYNMFFWQLQYLSWKTQPCEEAANTTCVFIFCDKRFLELFQNFWGTLKGNFLISGMRCPVSCCIEKMKYTSAYISPTH